MHWFASNWDIERLMSHLETLYPDIELSGHIPLVPAATCGSNFQGPVESSKIALAWPLAVEHGVLHDVLLCYSTLNRSS